MGLFVSTRMRFPILGVTFVIGCLSELVSPAAFAQLASRPSTEAARRPLPHAGQHVPSSVELKKWKAAITQVRPTKRGCFKSSYPNMAWQEVSCGAASAIPRLQPGHRRRPDIVGNQARDASLLSSGRITAATGSFDPTSTVVTGETGNTYDGNCNQVAPNVAEAFSLQLNTNTFTTRSLQGCGASGGDSCIGWVQFAYISAPNAPAPNVLGIQYQLINPGPTGCPPNWKGSASTACVLNVFGTPTVSQLTTAMLGTASLIGAAAQGGYDAVELYVGGSASRIVSDDSVLGLAGNWTEAEFNVFGAGCGSEANFTSGTTVSVNTSVIDGTTSIPQCDLWSFTAETNNLNLQPGALALGGSPPSIAFIESGDPGGTPAACVTAGTHGDTHIATFDGVLYDFQASGDFTLLQAGSDFTVQARQVPAKPIWPNASFNTAVGIRMGGNRVSLCLNPLRLMIDGRATELGDGKFLSIPGGVSVRRNGNAYLVANENGDSVLATARPSAGLLFARWIDVSVGLGRWRQKVSGLLANTPQHANLPPIRKGSVLSTWASFQELYHPYADSWRVPAGESLLCDGDVEKGIPEKPFYVEQLSPADRKRSRQICTAAGVKSGPLLDACMLDVTVLGDKGAVEPYTHARSPIRVVISPQLRQ